MREDVVDLILAAELSDRTVRVAMALLRLAGAFSGQVNIHWMALCALCRTKNRGAARRHLTALSKAGLIHYSTNEYVYITWKPFLRVGAQDLRVDAQAGNSTEVLNEAKVGEFARGRADSARGRATTSHAVVGWLVGSDPDPAGKEKPTNQPSRMDARVAALLADPLIGLNGPALRAAMGLEFEQVLTICVRWRIDFETGRCDGTGALLHRLRARWKQPALTETDRKHELYTRHGAEIERERRRKRYLPDEYRGIILGYPDEEEGS